jgi:hypothetical protein
MTLNEKGIDDSVFELVKDIPLDIDNVVIYIRWCESNEEFAMIHLGIENTTAHVLLQACEENTAFGIQLIKASDEYKKRLVDKYNKETGNLIN